MNRRFLLFVFLGCVILIAGMSPALKVHSAPQPLNAYPAGAPPVLVELFTSEGCSSCPPADAVLSALAKAPNVEGAQVIALEEHVDYWNQLGWTDRFSSHQFSERQGDYASAFHSDQVYTPQMIVDGQTVLVGSDMAAARAAIAKSAALPKASVQLSPASTPEHGSAKISFNVNVSDLPARGSGVVTDVLLAVTKDGLPSNVTSGENHGRRLVHDAVVEKLTVIGTIKPEQNTFTAAPVVDIPNKWRGAGLHVVVFVQERSSRKVLGAASTDLTESA